MCLNANHIYFYQGASISIRFGHTSMNPTDVAQNVLHGLEFAVGKLKHGWRGVQNVHLKTPNSPALPIFNRSGGDITDYIKSSSTTKVDEKEKKSTDKVKSGKRKASEDDASESTKPTKDSKINVKTKKQKTVEGASPKKSTPIAKKTRTQMRLKESGK